MTESELRAIGYLRQSERRIGETGLTSLSIRAQETRFSQWCASSGVTAVGVVSDHDIRGNVADRPGLHELRRRIVEDRVNTVWVISLSRLARDIIIHFSLIRELQTLGITRIYSDTEGEIADEFFHGILALMHAKSKTEQSAHLRGTFARRAKDGGFPVGATPLGYRRPQTIVATRGNGTTYERQTGRPAIDEEGAAIIRRIYASWTAGASAIAIANALDEDRVPTPRGGVWGERYMTKILRNPIYAGDIAHHGVVVAHNDDWQIVERATWDKAQRRFTHLVTVRNGPDHWLEGLVRHACGQRMYFAPRSNGLGGYQCLTARRVRSVHCGIARPSIAISLIDPAVRHALALDLAGVTPAPEALRIAQDLAGGSKASTARAMLDRRLAAAEARWLRNHERFSDGKLPPTVMDQEDVRLELERSAIAQEIAVLPQAPNPVEIGRVSRVLESLAETIPTMSDAELRLALLDLGHVEVGPDGVTMRYSIDPFGVFLAPATIAVKGRGRQDVSWKE